MRASADSASLCRLSNKEGNAILPGEIGVYISLSARWSVRGWRLTAPAANMARRSHTQCHDRGVPPCAAFRPPGRDATVARRMSGAVRAEGSARTNGGESWPQQLQIAISYLLFRVLICAVSGLPSQRNQDHPA
jgi:hypothetical protein